MPWARATARAKARKSQEGCKDAARRLQGGCTEAARKLQGSYKEAARLLQGGCKDVAGISKDAKAKPNCGKMLYKQLVFC